MNFDPESGAQLLKAFLEPWHQAIADPAAAQDRVLHNLVGDYAKTKYGQQHGAGNIETLEDYQRAFPVTTYDGDFKEIVEQVMAGDIQLLLWEEPIGWAITRGTTKGESKFIPMTPTDLQMRTSAGRAMLNFVASTERFELFSGVNLNLNFPSVVGKIETGDREIEYGYSSGIYTKYVSRFTPIRSVPSQEEIDALGGGKSIQDWERRFELAFQKNKDQNFPHQVILGKRKE